MSDEARGMPATETAAPRAPIEPDPGDGPVVPVEPADTGPGEAADWGELSDAFLTIWTEPRETIRHIVSVNPRYGFLLLAALGGSATTLTPRPGVASSGLSATLLVACTLGPLCNIAGLWFFAWAVRAVGSALLGGEASPEEMRAALAWANAPWAATLPLALLLAVLLAPGMHSLQDVGIGLSVVMGIAMVIAGVWSIVIGSQAVAEVQGYESGWKGFWNVALTLGILAALLVIVGAIVAGVARS